MIINNIVNIYIVFKYDIYYTYLINKIIINIKLPIHPRMERRFFSEIDKIIFFIPIIIIIENPIPSNIVIDFSPFI